MSESVKILVVVGGALILCYQDHNPGWFVVALLIFILDEVSAIRAAVAPKRDPRPFGPQDYDESDSCVKCEKEFKPGLKKCPYCGAEQTREARMERAQRFFGKSAGMKD
jgi:hypothetical protein